MACINLLCKRPFIYGSICLWGCPLSSIIFHHTHIMPPAYIVNYTKIYLETLLFSKKVVLICDQPFGYFSLNITNNPNPFPIGNKFGLYWFGAGGGTRTHTLSPTTDFESVTSANSITPAHLQSLREQISENGGMLGGMQKQNRIFDCQKYPKCGRFAECHGRWRSRF